MKNHLVAAAALRVASAAMAQSTVSLFGIVDAGANESSAGFDVGLRHSF